MTTGGSNTFIVTTDVDGERDPDGEEQGPVDEFKYEGNVVVSSGTVDHAGGKDPEEREDSPCTLRKYTSVTIRGDEKGMKGRGYSCDGETNFSPSGHSGKCVGREGQN